VILAIALTLRYKTPFFTVDSFDITTLLTLSDSVVHLRSTH